MRQNPRLFRLTASTALTALVCNAALPLAAVAQPAPPPLPQPYQSRANQSGADPSGIDPSGPDHAQTDPPARVGRVAEIAGTVSFHNVGDAQWSPAGINYPVSGGNAFWTEPAATTALEIAGGRIVLASTTEFDITTLDRAGLQAVAARGEVYLHLRDLGADEAWSVQTPRGLVRLDGAGRYTIVVGSTEQPTLVTVVEGGAEIDGAGVSLHLTNGETAALTGTDSFAASVGPSANDPFLIASLNAERPRTAHGFAVPAPVAAMPGGADLAGYGNWSQAPEYGQVWYPPVSPGWVPYREGHWASVEPWGWTWIDDASWGFAPFHYGRWVELGGRWAWTPGSYSAAEPPTYAPALVAFIGIGAGVAIGAAIASHSIGWVPLGPREPYRPWYHASDRYVREVNVNNVTTTTNNNFTINNFANRGAATVVPAAAMLASRPVQSVAQPLTPQEFAAARPIVGQPLPPRAATGAAPRLPAAAGLAAAPAISPPGPAVGPRAPGPPGGGFARTAPGPSAPGPSAPGPSAHPDAGNPLRLVGGTPPLVPGHPPRVAPPATTPVVIAPQAPRPPASPPPPSRPSASAPSAIRPAEPAARPNVPTRTTPHEEQRPMPQVVGPTPSVPPHQASTQPAPRQELRTFAPATAVPRIETPQPRIESPRAGPAAPMPQHAAAAPNPPPQAARQLASPAPRPEPPRTATQERPKRPGEP